MSSEATLSIVLPVRNMASSLATAVAECMAVAGRHLGDYEIIIVDDCSSDTTGDQADQLAAAYAPVMVLHQPQPLGYAAALRAAWPVVRGEYLVAIDLVGPANLADIPRLLGALPSHAVVAGYRIRPPRLPLSRLYVAATRAALGVDLRDPALRFAAFRADLREFLPLSVPDNLAHAELYARAQAAGLPVAQVGIEGRRGRAGRLAPAALIELISYRPPQAAHRPSALLGAGLLAAAGSLWVLWRRRKG